MTSFIHFSAFTKSTNEKTKTTFYGKYTHKDKWNNADKKKKTRHKKHNKNVINPSSIDKTLRKKRPSYSMRTRKTRQSTDTRVSGVLQSENRKWCEGRTVVRTDPCVYTGSRCFSAGSWTCPFSWCCQATWCRVPWWGHWTDLCASSLTCCETHCEGEHNVMRIPGQAESRV